MGLVAFVQLAERLLKQAPENPQDGQHGEAKTKPAAAGGGVPNGNSDAFVRSGDSRAEDVGTFEVPQVSVFSAAANLLLAESDAASRDRQPAPERQAPPIPAGRALVLAAPAGGPPNRKAAPAGASASNIHVELSDLNAALVTLGLTQREITVVDRIARLIEEFNPAAFTDLIHQLQLLAQSIAPEPAPDEPAASAETPGRAAGSFAIESLSVQFNALNGTVALPGGQRGSARLSGFELQVQAVTLTLNNPSTGESARIEAPHGPSSRAAVPLRASSATA